MKRADILIQSITLLGSIVLLVLIIAWMVSVSRFNEPPQGPDPDQNRIAHGLTNQPEQIPEPQTGGFNTLMPVETLAVAGNPETRNSPQEIQPQETGWKNNLMKAEKTEARGTMDSDAGREELDTMFGDFLAENGLSIETEMAAATGSSLSVKRKAPGTHISDTDDAHQDETASAYSDTDKQLMASYDLEGIKLTDTGELWIKLDSDEINESTIHEMMTEAASLHGDGTGPLKVVVWQGRRPAVIKTFFGEPIF